MSLINFLNPKLKPSVECDAVCEDGYEATNLISDDVEQLGRGFMAFSVTKPPVDIIFEFPKVIDLKVIKLWNSNGALRSTSFEIVGKYEGIWERVAYARELPKTAESVTFCYQSDYSSRNSATDAQRQCSENVFFFKTAHKILSNTNFIKITIRGTQKCAPVLRKVQVWGLPSRSLEKIDRELIRTIWSEITNPYDIQYNKDGQSGQRSPSRNVPELSEHSELKIPEDFLDAITWELMIFPTVLPSGKVVDQSTIDKHSEVESKWGRMPSDPFTGLEFTSHRKAILNLALKARIEKFLMENSNHFKTVPRSLGSSRVRRSKNRHASQFASLCQDHSLASGAYSRLTGTNECATYTSSAASASLSTPALSKRPKLSDASLPFGSLHSGGGASSRTAVFSAHSTATRTTATVDYDRAILTSLGSSSGNATTIDDAVKKARAKITCYTNPPAETMPPMCISCKSQQFAYEIQTCKHLVCRQCIVQLTKDQMCICKTSFRNADVERYHRY